MALTCCRESHHTPATLSPAHTPCPFSIDLHSRATLGDRSFSFASSPVWNSIPNDVRCAPSSKSRLKTYLTCSVYIDRTFSLTLYICARLGLVIILLMAFLKNALMCIKNIKKKKEEVKLINHDCLSILMLLYIMLAYLMLPYLMLFVCIMLFLAIDFCKCFLFSCIVLVY